MKQFKKIKKKSSFKKLPILKILVAIAILPLAVMGVKKIHEFNTQAKQSLQAEEKIAGEYNADDLETKNHRNELLSSLQLKATGGAVKDIHTLPKTENFDEVEEYHLIKYWEINADVSNIFQLDGDIFAQDYFSKKIHRYTHEGKHIITWQYNDPNAGAYSVRADDEYIYMVNYSDSVIRKYNTRGELIQTIGELGSDDGQFVNPYDLSINKKDNNLYITDTNNNRVQVFDRDGNFIRTIGSGGSENGQFITPTSIIVKDDKLYVSDYAQGGRIQILTLDGQWLKTIPIQTSVVMWERPYDQALFVYQLGQNVVHLYNRNDEIQQTILQIGGFEISEIRSIGGLIFDQSNNMYVADSRTMKVFSLDGQPPTYNEVTPLVIKDENGQQQPLQRWYKNMMRSAVPDNVNYSWFSAWKSLTIDNSLYLLLGTGRPAEHNGAALVKAKLKTANTLEPTLISVQNRQTDSGEDLWYMEDDGVLDMDKFNVDNLLIAGVDPGYSDNWSGGNAYTLSAQNNKLVKIRCKTATPQWGDCGPDNHVFGGVVHSFATTVLDDSILFVGASELQNHPVYPTKGTLYKSTNSGSTWSKIGSLPESSYRIYDLNIIKNRSAVTDRNKSVALFANAYEGALYVSRGSYETVGTTWQPYVHFYAHRRIKGLVVNDKYYVIDRQGAVLNILSLASDGSISRVQKPLNIFRVGAGDGENAYKFNVLTASNNALFIVSDGGYIYKANLNGENWHRIADLRQYTSVISLHYWEEEDKLVAVTKGENAQVLLIPTSSPNTN